MYGLVLLVAITSGSESADFGRRGGRGCCGCTGYVSCGGGYGGCYGGYRGGYGCGGCYGGGYGGGCYGGGYGGGCYGGYSGGCGGGYVISGGYGCTGSGYSGGCTGSGYIGGYSGCTGSAIPTGTIGAGCAGSTPGQVVGQVQGQISYAAPANAATVVVKLPADAKLNIDGNPTTSTSSVRTFQSPELKPGKVYAYTLDASFEKEGKTVKVSKKVSIEAGKVTEVDFNKEAPVTGVARN